MFENPAFRPDGLKIYPTLVIRGTGLYELWKTGRYKSYPPQVLVDLVAQILSFIPPWTRVYVSTFLFGQTLNSFRYRVQRDIPMPLVTSGVEYGNLREHALDRMKSLGLTCRDVRTRETGIQVNIWIYNPRACFRRFTIKFDRIRLSSSDVIISETEAGRRF